MSARGGFRGGYNSQSGYSGKGSYNHNYSHSSGHGTPNSSFHGSPPPQSPYSGSGRSYSQGDQFSPQSQYPSQHQHGSFGSQSGPQSQFSHSPPYPPNGPSSQYPTGPGYRGGRGGSFRGGQFSGRGGHRGNFKNTQWNSGSPHGSRGSNGAGGRRPSDDLEPSQESAHASPVRTESENPKEDGPQNENDNPFRPSRDLQVEDMARSQTDQEAKETMLPPSRPPPTGPQAQTNKFSFSMKSTSKPAVAAPRPEISFKFNAAPPRPEPPKAPEKPSERDRGGLPKNVPTEPASVRGRNHNDRRPSEPMKHPEPPPRTRKVKKALKRLKTKPKLSPEMATSKSVYFRKPGNESVVGSGTYGKVFKGLNVYTKKLVALKKIRMEGERDGFPVTAVREIKLLRSLKHINIVQLQEVMVETNECFMVFEYLSHDLTGLLNHPTYKLDMAQKKHLAQQLFDGLDYLHTRGVLHRDIKAANILVSSEGILKLADFGLARFYAKHHQLDYTNRVITIWYRSPELLLGETQYGPAVDIWSAACVFWEFFAQSAIFAGDGSEINQLDKIWAVLGTPNKKDWPNLTEMPWFELLRPSYRKANVFDQKYKERVPSQAAFDLLKWMFHFDPAKRPTAAEVLQHAYFTKEEPAPRQAIELKDIEGDWHEFESKALRREKERQEREARRAAREAAAAGAHRGDKDRKRPNDASDPQREAKRANVESKARPGASSTTMASSQGAGDSGVGAGNP
ncbi:Pkinase-domain-containing protein [Thozetella sp. PMI_491]|nr:Pkinase-domain-containing protein [Thozetella sp. PMI_491]